MRVLRKISSLLCLSFITINYASSQAPQQYDLAKLFRENKLSIANRSISTATEGSRNCIIMEENFEEGLAWLNGVVFSTGTIEFDVKGQDVFQHSFVGLAFYGVDNQTFDAVYFRPFHFRATEEERQKKQVQYVSLPEHTWQRLRESADNIYENPVHPVPDPDNWFHVKIILKDKKIQVFVDDAETPSLDIPLLSNRSSGKIGLYTADRSGGSFANLVLRNE